MARARSGPCPAPLEGAARSLLAITPFSQEEASCSFDPRCTLGADRNAQRRSERLSDTGRWSAEEAGFRNWGPFDQMTTDSRSSASTSGMLFCSRMPLHVRAMTRLSTGERDLGDMPIHSTTRADGSPAFAMRTASMLVH